MQENVKVNDIELRAARAIARADAAADRLNKICDILEIYTVHHDGEGSQDDGLTCERMACAESAIIELAEVIGEMM